MPVRIDIYDGPRGPRITMRSPWYPNAATEAKSVTGASWNKTGNMWTYPLSLQTCRDMRKVFGDRLVIEKRLWRWATREMRREKALHRLGRQHDSVLRRVPTVAPRVAAAMATRTYQRSGAAFIAKSRKVLIADEPTLGKTITYLGGLMEADLWEGMHLVSAPKTALTSTWARQIRQWTPDADAYPMPEGRANREAAIRDFLASDAATKMLLVNPAMLQTKVSHWCKKCSQWKHVIEPTKTTTNPNYIQHFLENHKYVPMIEKQEWPILFEQTWSSVVVDESHEIFSSYTPANVPQVVEGMLRIETIENGARVALSGTPLRGRERRIWGTLSWLGAAPGGYWDFVQNYFEVVDNFYGKSIGGLRPDRKDDFYALLDVSVLRRLKKEVRPEIGENPPAVDHWVEMTPKQAKIYRQFEAEGEAALANGLLSSTGLLSEMTRLTQLCFGEWVIGKPRKDRKTGRQITALTSDKTCKSPKLERLVEWLRERGVTGNEATEWRNESGGHKYVVVSRFTDVIDVVEAALNRLGIETLKVTGAVTGAKRERAIRQFDGSPDGPRVFLMNTKAGGTSIDLDTYCDELVILDETYIDDDQVQVMGRINNRKGEVRPRWLHFIRTLDTVEEGIATGNVGQAHLTAAMLDIRRGVRVNVRTLTQRGST